MPVHFFADNESNGDGDKLFATEYLAANKKDLDKRFTITEVVLARSGKGYMVHTEHFICWMWKKSKVTSMLIEALQAYVSTSKGYHLFATLTNKNKDCYVLGVDTDVNTRWYEMGNGSYSLTPLSSSSTEQENPFLPHALSPLIGDEELQEGEDVLPIRGKKRA